MAIIKCDCKSEYQDALYGAGNRVHTEGGKKLQSDKVNVQQTKLRCTVCGKEKK